VWLGVVWGCHTWVVGCILCILQHGEELGGAYLGTYMWIGGCVIVLAMVVGEADLVNVSCLSLLVGEGVFPADIGASALVGGSRDALVGVMAQVLPCGHNPVGCVMDWECLVVGVFQQSPDGWTLSCFKQLFLLW
jgi:hypothetical protein